MGTYFVLAIFDLTFWSLAALIFPKYLSYLVWGLVRVVSLIRLLNNRINGIRDAIDWIWDLQIGLFDVSLRSWCSLLVSIESAEQQNWLETAWLRASSWCGRHKGRGRRSSRSSAASSAGESAGAAVTNVKPREKTRKMMRDRRENIVLRLGKSKSERTKERAGLLLDWADLVA